MKRLSQSWQYVAKFFLEWEMFQTNLVDKIKTHKWRHRMAHTICRLDKQGYMHAHACTSARSRAHARARARARTHTHTNV